MKFTVYGLLLKNKVMLGAGLPHEWGDGYPLGGVLNSEKSFVDQGFSLFMVGCWTFCE
jgi:hypothetical protein